ncbi:hypothetical protein [Corynebacterium sp. NML 120412]|uniref:hypothetical protein n=1 Tax=Corynebacterium sp. NML 120412 TaxID=2029401 RepID=UPI0018E9F8A6
MSGDNAGEGEGELPVQRVEERGGEASPADERRERKARDHRRHCQWQEDEEPRQR